MEKMYSDLAALEEDPEKLVPALTHIWNAVNATQASNMKHSHGNKGIHILSVVIYAGDDQAARPALDATFMYQYLGLVRTTSSIHTRNSSPAKKKKKEFCCGAVAG